MTTTKKSGLAVGVREETAVWVNRTERGPRALSIPTDSVHGWCLGSERLSLFLGAANLTALQAEARSQGQPAFFTWWPFAGHHSAVHTDLH